MKERDFIQNVKGLHQAKAQFLVKGIGDDCAVFAESDDFCWVISTDILVENIHFSLSWHDPYLLGRKSIAVNLSDIAAMGADPRFVLLSIAIPSSLDAIWCNKFNDGVASMLQEFNCTLIGGDTAKGALLTINISILGTSKPQNVAYRSSAAVNDDIYVTGLLGSAAAGLELYKHKEMGNDAFRNFYKSHLDPQPQVVAGSMLADSHLVKAMQDISDGLSTDISHICKESGVGAILYQDRLPFEKGLENVCKLLKLNFFDLVLNGGEDYQLVFTASKTNRKKIEELFYGSEIHPVIVGRIRQEPGVFLEGEQGKRKEITFKGFEHNSRSNP